MQQVRRELKVVVALAVAAVLVAVAGAVALSLNLSSQVDEQRSAARTLRGEVASLTDSVDTERERAEDMDETNKSLTSGFHQCQRALKLTAEVFEAILLSDGTPTEAEVAEVELKARQADDASIICLGRQLDLVDTI